MATQRDDNFENASLVVDNVTGLPVPLKVDPVTGYLLVDIIAESSSDLNISTKIDENFEGVAMATDNSTGDARPLKVNNNNKLLCNIA